MYKATKEETITKLEIAKRELSEAVRLFFEDRDPVTYYLLGHASHEIISKIANARGINSIKDDMTTMISEDALDEILTASYGKEYKPKRKNLRKKIDFFVNIEYDKIKHGGNNPDEEVSVHWDTIQILILDSIEMLRSIGVALSSEHIAFMLWVKKEFPDIYNNTETLKALDYFEENIGGVNKENLLNFIESFKVSGLEEFLQEQWQNKQV